MYGISGNKFVCPETAIKISKHFMRLNVILFIKLILVFFHDCFALGAENFMTSLN